MGGEYATNPEFADLDSVALVRGIESGGRFLPVGSKGTVVAIWGGGAAYEVEFSEPFHALETVEVGDLVMRTLGVSH